MSTRITSRCRARRNNQLKADDLTALESILIASGAGAQVDTARASERSGGLRLFIWSLVGLDRGAATNAFAAFLDGSVYSADQVRFVGLLIDELTANGVLEPGRLFESPYIDSAPTGPDFFFPDTHEDAIVKILHGIKPMRCPVRWSSKDPGRAYKTVGAVRPAHVPG